MAGEFERLAYDVALRGLDKQERLLEELRARTGVLLAASSLAVSVLGQPALQQPHPRALAIGALFAFLTSIGSAAFVLIPRDGLLFTQAPVGLYERLLEIGGDMAEVHRRLTYDLHELWSGNNLVISVLVRVYRLGAAALAIEVIFLSALIFNGRVA